MNFSPFYYCHLLKGNPVKEELDVPKLLIMDWFLRIKMVTQVSKKLSKYY